MAAKRTKKKISQLRVWQLLADAWADALAENVKSQAHVYAVIGGSECSGLCTAILALYACYEFDRSAALAVIRNAFPWLGNAEYAWSRTLSGAEERAAFCRRQVRRLQRKKKKKP